MALIIVRNDITKTEADAIVNSTNPALQVGGLGVDAAVHAAAGPRLREALTEIGGCPYGGAVVTEAFDIPTCRYIIHAVPPVYHDGAQGEEEALRECYRNVLRLAREKGCRSLAVPTLASGANGFPRADAYRVATSCIREFLFSLPGKTDMQVYLVLFSKESVDVGEKIDAGVRQFISDADTLRKKNEMAELYHYRPRWDRRENLASVFESFGAMPTAMPPCGIDMEAAICAPPEEENYEDVDLSFADMCEWWCKRKGLSKNRFYTRANINKAMFWNMKHHPGQIPKKTNVLACAVGLGLDLDQTQDLLKRAGMTLSKYYEMDLVVEYFIREGNHNIDVINGVLFDRDLPLLGTY